MQNNEPCARSPATKRIYPDYFSREELSKVLGLRSYRQELNVLKQELDSLDDFYLLDSQGIKQQTLRKSVGNANIPCPADLAVCNNRICGSHYCVYIPPRRGSQIEYDKCSNDVIKEEQKLSVSEIALDARREASVLHQVAELRKQGFWSSSRLPKIMEPKAKRVHHHHLLREAIWMSVDFDEERKWKKQMAYNLVRAAQAYLYTRQEWNKQIILLEEQIRIRNAFRVAKMVKRWWSEIDGKWDKTNLALHHNRWKFACKRNQILIAQFSDMVPRWIAGVEFEVKPEPFDAALTYPLNYPQIHSDGEVDDTDDIDWKPYKETDKFDSNDRDDSINSCSRSTSSSRALSFIDDCGEANQFGIVECSSSDIDIGEDDNECIDDIASANLYDVKISTSPSYSTIMRPNLPLDTSVESGCENIKPGSKRKLMSRETSKCLPSDNDSDIEMKCDCLESMTTSQSDDPIGNEQHIQSDELQHLITDIQIPLSQILEPYMQRGWNRANRNNLHFSDSDITDSEVEFDDHVPNKKLITEISLLEAEAEMPVEDLLPAGYLFSVDQDNSLRNVNTDANSQGLRHRRTNVSCANEFRNSNTTNFPNTPLSVELDEMDTVDSESENPSFSVRNIVNEEDQFRSGALVNQVTTYAPPWCDCTEISYPFLNTLHSSAVELLPLKVTPSSNSEVSQFVPELCTLAYGPTLRVLSLPTSGLGAAVTWLRHAFLRAVPGLLLSNNHLSGDAELAVVAHLGQLAVANPRYYLPSGLLPGHKQNDIIGDWGPHLIIVPHLCLPAWRNRLSTWCPGFRVICLGLGSEPDGTGRRLRSSVGQGAVNICLTSYTALRSHPSRFTRIKWSTIVFDQIHHVINNQNHQFPHGDSVQPVDSKRLLRPQSSEYAASNFSSCENSSCADSLYDNYRNMNSNQDNDTNAVNNCDSINQSFNWLNSVLSKLICTGHSLLIYSAVDPITTKHRAQLMNLCKLLFCKQLTENGKFDLTDFFQLIQNHNNQRHPIPNNYVNNNIRPTKKQLLKFIDPFILRFDEDYEWDSYVNEEVISCPLSDLQQNLHYVILTTKAAENALKTGNLLDFLQTVSVALRVCTHPCLITNPSRSSRYFRSTVDDLLNKTRPSNGPFVFHSITSESSALPNQFPGLQFHTPKSVLYAVKHLRESEFTDTTKTYFNLSHALYSSSYIRKRIASLAAPFAPGSPSNSTNHPAIVNNYRHNTHSISNIELLPGSRFCRTSGNPNAPITNGTEPDYSDVTHTKLRMKLTNGLPENEHQLSMMNHSSLSPRGTDVDLVSIPQRQKRQRGLLNNAHNLNTDTISTASSCSESPQNKRRRLVGESGDMYNNYEAVPDGDDNGMLTSPNDRTKGTLSSLPFLCSDTLSFMESMDRLRRRCDAAPDALDSPPDESISHIAEQYIEMTKFSTMQKNGYETIDVNSRPHLKDNTRKCTQLVGFDDWCCAESCGQFQLSQSPLSTTPYYTDSLHSVQSIVSSQFNTYLMDELCFTKSRVIAFTPCLTIDNKSGTSLKSNLSDSCSITQPSNQALLEQFTNQLYSLCEPARWLSSRSNLNHFNGSNCWSYFDKQNLTCLGRLFNESGKFSQLNLLLRKLLGHSQSAKRRRPRCVFILAHQSALLDLLDAFLSASEWKQLTRIYLPNDHKSVGASTGVLIDRINNWPNGVMGPLILLAHARCPSSFLMSLRAGTDVPIIICDVDWRAEVTDNLRAIIHSWMLNGLATHLHCDPIQSDYNGSKIKVYRLIACGDVGYATSHPTSVEACMFRGVACRLLPRAVFHAHSAAHVGRRSLLFARVQPNVVNALLSCLHVPKRADRSLCPTAKSRPDLDLFSDRNFLTVTSTLKQETLTYSPASSITSSFSCAADNRLDDYSAEKPIDDDDLTLFQEREPLSEQLLHCALELFEDPLDTQAWCCANAEQSVLSNELNLDFSYNNNHQALDTDFHLTWNLNSEINICSITNQFTPLDVIGMNHRSYNHISQNEHSSNLLKQLNYSNLIGWEIATQELLTQIDNVDNQTWGDDMDCLCYVSSDHSTDHILAESPTISEKLAPLMINNDRPIWCPLDLEMEPVQNSVPDSKMPSSDGLDQIVEFVQFPWGYETLPMSDNELPSLPTSSLPMVNQIDAQSKRHSVNHMSTTVTTTSTTSCSSSCSSVSSVLFQARGNEDTSFHLSSVYRNNSRLSATGQNLKRRRLTGAAAASRRNSIYATMMNSSSTHSLIDASDANYVNGSNGSELRSGSQTLARDSCPSTFISLSISSPGISTISASSGNAGSGTYSNNAILLTLHTNASSATTASGTKLYIPRVSYTKEVTNARVHRLRRLNTTNSASSTDAAAAATVVALAAGAHLLQQPHTQPQQQQLNQSTSGYHNRGQHLASAVAAAAAAFSPWSSFANPALLARYGHPSYQSTTSGNNSLTRYLNSSLQNFLMSNTSQLSSMKYGIGGAQVPGVSSNTSNPNAAAAASAANQLYVGKPPDWLIYEEAGLYQCISRLQELGFEMTNSSNASSTIHLSNCAPNYRLAEFFLNNYVPTRSYRGARQCLLAHFKIQNVVSSANTATSSCGSGPTPGSVGTSNTLSNLNNSFTPFNSDESSGSLPINVATSHGPSSRKVKNKLKSAAAAVASNLSGSGTLPFGPAGVAGTGTHGVNAALNRCRGYLFYQHLQSWLNMVSASSIDFNQTATTTSDSVSSIPPSLSQIFHAIRSVEDSHAYFLRKVIKDSLSTPVQVAPLYRPTGSRRNCVGSGIISSNTGSGSSSVYYSNIHSSTASVSAHYGHQSSHHPHHHHSLTPNSASHPVSNTPALLSHYRHRHHTTTDQSGQTILNNATSNAASTDSNILGSMSGSNLSNQTTGVVHSGPVIQKNLTHIAALQEHNINPDTLITPAMVIKNKEEREARQRAEALSVAANMNVPNSSTSATTINFSCTTASLTLSNSSITTAVMSSQPNSYSICSTSSLPTTTDSTSLHHSHVESVLHNTHPQDGLYRHSMHYTVGQQLSVGSMEMSMGNNSTGSMRTATSQLSFTHNNTTTHRGASVMLPIRSAFGTGAVAPAGTILSLSGQQYQQRLISAASTTAAVVSSSSASHFQYQPRQTLLHSSTGRLTHLTSNNQVGAHIISSSCSSPAVDEVGNRNMELANGNILIPSNWRTISNARSFNVQTIMSSTPTMLRRSSTFTSLGPANTQSNTGLQATVGRLTPCSTQNNPPGYLNNTQVIRGSSSSNFYLQQRSPQFVSVSQTGGPLVTRGALPSASNLSVVSSAVGSYPSSMTHLPQILRPRSNPRGSVVQPTFVRTISVSGSSVGPVSGAQVLSCLTPTASANMVQGRVTLTVSSTPTPISNIINSRGLHHS